MMKAKPCASKTSVCLIFSYYFLLAELAFQFAEEKENPELLAESPFRRKRIAQESGKTEQQVHRVDCLSGWLKAELFTFHFSQYLEQTTD